MTPLHIGVGRSPGVVDLPVIRDSYGLPFVPASSLKGVLKSSCLLSCGYSRGSCGDCLKIYGWDIRLEGGPPEEASVSALAFGDAFLAFYPVRFDDGRRMVFGYATSIAQLAQLLDIIGACAGVQGSVCLPVQLMQHCISLDACSHSAHGFFNNVPVGGGDYISCDDEEGPCMAARRLASVLLDGAGSLARLLGERLYVFRSQEVFREVVEAGMLRQTRVRLNPVKKVVEAGALWTEEYVPQATLFAGMVAARPTPHINADEAMRFLEDQLAEANHTFFIGGKETIGKGFARISLHRVDAW